MLEPGWPLKLTLDSSGLISAPFERSSSRSKSVSAKSAVWVPVERLRSAAEGWPLQLKLDSGQLWQGVSHGRHQQADAPDLKASPLPPAPPGGSCLAGCGLLAGRLGG